MPSAIKPIRNCKAPCAGLPLNSTQATRPYNRGAATARAGSCSADQVNIEVVTFDEIALAGAILNLSMAVFLKSNETIKSSANRGRWH